VKFNNFLGRQKDVYVKKNGIAKDGSQLWCSEVAVMDQKLWNDLNNKGCTPNKSLILKFPDLSIFKDESLVRHFIRGYFDGDGCVSWTRKDRKTPSAVIIGTEDFLKGVEKCFGEKAYICHKKDKSAEVFRFNLTDVKAFRFLDFIYKDATIYLDRKYNRYLDFVPSYSGRSK
jgi:intein/homing endonuclease